jgi:hypothetical protein
MAGYGVPQDLDGVLPWSWAEERLVANRNYWVVTVDSAGSPHAMPVWGVWLGERFWFSSAASALKVRNIADNPRVAVMTADTVEVVSVEGVARSVAASSEIAAAWAAKYEPDPQRRRELVGAFQSNAAFAVDPVRAFGLIETPQEFSRSATRWVWGD